MSSDPQDPALTRTPVGPRYWRSLDELGDTPGFREWLYREFPQGASEAEGVDRRHFLRIMTASFALGGLGMAGCRRPESNIRPYAKQPERVMPGVPVHYASSQPRAHGNIPLVVQTYQNRPTKLEGNPGYEPFGGGTDAQTQASVLDLYDPDRGVAHYKGGSRIDAAQVNDLLAGANRRFAGNGGRGLAVLAEPSTSLTRARLAAQLRQAMPGMIWAEYEPLDRGNPDRAAQMIFHGPARLMPDFAAAKRILALDCDFLQNEPGAMAHARAFTAGRKVHSPEQARDMSRLYVVESSFTLTGAMADHRLRLPGTHIAVLPYLLMAEFMEQRGSTGAAELREQIAPFMPGVQIDPAWVRECVRDLLEHRGETLIVAGAHLPVEAHLLVAWLNQMLGANGRTMRGARLPRVEQPASLSQLAAAIDRGGVDTLVILGGNPVYDAPGDLDWPARQKRVPNVVRLGYSIDETSHAALQAGGHHILEAHYLESWDDGRTFDGTIVPVQPTIMPLFNGLTANEVLARLAGAPTADPYQLVFDTFSQLTPEADKQHAFNRFLYQGYLEGSAYALEDELPGVPVPPLPGTPLPEVSDHALEVRILHDHHTHDGRYANNGWLQELPDPITKLTWDNAICISPALAARLGFDPSSTRLLAKSARDLGTFKRGKEHAPVGVLEIAGTKVSGPVIILPGMADNTVTVTLGYGRTRTGRVGTGTGFSAYPLTRAASMGLVNGARLTLIDADLPLANTQQHWSMEGRAIVREGNLQQFMEAPDFAQHIGMESHSPNVYGAMAKLPLEKKVTSQPRGESIYQIPEFDKPAPNVPVWNTPEGLAAYKAPQQWGMAIDLNACIGCTACVTACQAENNIPIVGRDQVRRGREMHWIRIDRYFASGDVAAQPTEIPHDVQVAFQPMLCQHCERAPCEQVCPVNATVHDSEGLNVMAYNRCVGTRYCSNNCPYKVRRFNFMDWNKREIGHFYEGPLGPNKYEQGVMGELTRMQKNPDVTVRMRGVMEKCTFCLQRIERAKIAQRVKVSIDPTADPGNVHVPDGLIKTACQQVCPTGAIVFGDVSDANSDVYRLKQSPRNYSVLGYLNTRPRTTYLARLRNPNPRMPDAYAAPYSYEEYQQKSGGGHEEGGEHGSGDHGEAVGHDAEIGVEQQHPPAPGHHE